MSLTGTDVSQDTVKIYVKFENIHQVFLGKCLISSCTLSNLTSSYVDLSSSAICYLNTFFLALKNWGQVYGISGPKENRKTRVRLKLPKKQLPNEKAPRQTCRLTFIMFVFLKPFFIGNKEIFHFSNPGENHPS